MISGIHSSRTGILRSGDSAASTSEKHWSICRQKAADTVAAETAETLAGPSGFEWLKFTRAETHVYNIRHIQHHTGQLGAYLRRFDEAINPKWVGSGWK